MKDLGGSCQTAANYPDSLTENTNGLPEKIKLAGTTFM